MEFKRGQLGRRIERYNHPKYGGDVPIYLDASTGTFSAVVGDVILKDDQLYKVRRLVDDTLKNRVGVEWIPIIEIGFGWNSRDYSDDEKNSIDKSARFDFKRYWIARKIDGFWIQATWDTDVWPSGQRPKRVVGDRLERSREFKLLMWNKDTRSHDRIKGDLKLPYVRKREDRDENPTYYVEHTDALWTTLMELSKRMDSLQDKLIDVLGSTEKRAALTEHIGKLLPAAKS